MNREAIMAALFTLVSTLPGLVTKSRRPRYWSDVPASETPALFLVAGDQTPKNDASGAPVTWTLDATLYLYVHSQDPDVPPSVLLNGILDHLDALLLPPCPGAPWPAGFSTLGGLVRHLWISGQIETSGDVLGDLGIAIIPLSMLVAA
jgi:hypothetical protein